MDPDLAVRTLLISDLHIGSPDAGDLLRLEEPRERLLAAIPPGGRLVVLGDVLEVRGTTFARSWRIARPILEAIGDRLGPDGTLVLMVGNHDYGLLAHWFEARKQRDEPIPLGIEQRFPAEEAGPLVAQIAEALPCRVEFAYPGLWLRDDVFALHGHYAEAHGRLMTEERLISKVTAWRHGLPRADAVPDDYEAVLAPYYAVRQQLGQYPPRRDRWDREVVPRPWPPERVERGTLGSQATRLLVAAIAGDAQQAIKTVLQRLGVEAPYVIWGHSHRAGPWPEDRDAAWRTAGGGRILNTGSWLCPPGSFAHVRGSWPFWPGTAVELDPTGPPRLVRLLETP